MVTPAQTILGLATDTDTATEEALPNHPAIGASTQEPPKFVDLHTPLEEGVNTTSGLLFALANLE